MSLSDKLTVLVITFNEEDNIARTLSAVAWAPRILVVDSGSTDGTLDIIRQFPQARVVTRPFDSFAAQCNFGLSQIEGGWVLSLDADYVVASGLRDEIGQLDTAAPVKGYVASFIYRVQGHALRATLYPARTVLYHHGFARYRDEGHGHRVEIDGDVRPLKSRIYHDDRKPLARWLQSQQRYARVEADHLLSAARGELGIADRIRRAGWPAPILVFVYTFFWKGCILDGWPGWLYVLQRLLAECMIAVEIVDRRIQRRGAPVGSAD